MKLALALLWDRKDECPGAVPVLVCHDEVVVECDAEQAADVKAWLEKAMIKGDGCSPERRGGGRHTGSGRGSDSHKLGRRRLALCSDAQS